MTRWYERYMQGYRQEVYDELLGLQERVFDEPYYGEAVLVAREIMRRVRSNIERLIPRLHALKYRFGAGSVYVPHAVREQLPSDQQISERDYPIFRPPSPDAAEQMQLLEELVGSLPLCLKAFYEEVGSVNFIGLFQVVDGRKGRRSDGCWFDPLLITSLEETLEEVKTYQEIGNWENDPKLELAPDRDLKYDYSGSGPYSIAVPCQAFDAPFGLEGETQTFVQYLQRCFQWGGFPGLAEKPDLLPPDHLAYLTRGLLPVLGEHLKGLPQEEESDEEVPVIDEASIPDAPSLQRLLADCHSEDENRRTDAILWVKHYYPEAATEVLLDLLAIPDHPTRGFAIAMLGEMGDRERVGPALLKALDDPKVRVHAVRVLHRLDYIPARAALGRLLLHDPSKNVRIAAAQALADLGDEGSGAELEEALQDEEAGVRLEVIRALGLLGDVAVLPRLQEELVAESKAGLRYQLLIATYRLGARENLDVLLNELEAAATNDAATTIVWRLNELVSQKSPVWLHEDAARIREAVARVRARLPGVRLLGGDDIEAKLRELEAGD